MSLPSSLKPKPFRTPGQPLDEELMRLREDTSWGYLIFIGGFALLAFMEGYGYFFGLPRTAVVFTLMAVLGVLATVFHLRRIRVKAERVRMARESDRLVTQSFAALRSFGANVIHDVRGDGFNLEHVVICDRGLYVVETKLWPRRRNESRISFTNDLLFVDGVLPKFDPILQLRAKTHWLSNLLEQLAGEATTVNGALLFPGWSFDSATQSLLRDVWVGEPGALPEYIEREPQRLSADSVAQIAMHLSQYVGPRVRH